MNDDRFLELVERAAAGAGHEEPPTSPTSGAARVARFRPPRTTL